MPLRPENDTIGGFLPEADLKRPIPESDGLGTAGKIAGGVALGAGMLFAPEITLPAMAIGGGASLFADSEGAAAAFRTENTIGSTLASKSYWFDGERDPSYDPWADIAGTPYEEYWDNFTTARSKPHADAIRADIDREVKDRRYLENQGAIGYAQGLAAGIFDPTILLPGGAIVRGAKGGASAIRTAGSVAAYSAGGAALTEGVLQATQQTRTWEESATAIAGATVLSGVLGAGLARRAGREIDAWGSAVETDLARPAPTGCERASSSIAPSGSSKPIVEAAAGASPRALEVADAIRQTAEEILPPEIRVQVVDTLGAPGDEGLFGIRAFHGGPHDFDRFDMDKLGTGEGAQVYGHGLYFAENEAVAGHYRDTLGGVDITVDGKPIIRGKQTVGSTGSRVVDSALAMFDGDIGAAIVRKQWAKQAAEDYGLASSERIKEFDDEIAELRAFKGKIEKGSSGHLYEVEIDAEPSRLLDLDEKVGKQPVAGAIADLLLKLEPRFTREQMENMLRVQYGKHVYDEIAFHLNDEPARASKALREAGIPGLRFFDAGSRGGAGEGSRNIVVFDDSLIKITKKNGEAVTPAERKAAVDAMFGLRGFYSPAIRAAESISMKKGTGEQFFKQITKAGGVRRDEIEWMGLEEFLSDKKSITKEEVLAFMRAHQVELDERVLGADAGGPSKFEEHKIPGGENYRELLIRLPQLEGKYTSKHFQDQEIVHLRIDDRAGPNGEKVLFLNEVQSDLHQMGRKQGSEEDDAEVRTELEAKLKTLKDQLSLLEDARRSPDVNEREKYYDARENVEQVERELSALTKFSKAPNAPFKGDLWLELALKRALLYAAENRYDAISWARSDQIAKAVGARPEKLALQYDQKIGKFLSKYTAKWNGKVEETRLPDFAKGTATLENRLQFALRSDLDEATKVELREVQHGLSLGETEADGLAGLSPAGRRALEGVQVEGEGATNSLLRVTPEMRSSVMEGQPFGLRQGSSGTIAEGRFDPGKLLITIAADALDPAKTLRHESIHVLKQMGLFTGKDWKALSAAAKKQGWIESNNVRQLYEGVYKDRITDDLLTEEAIAEQFGLWRQGAAKFDKTTTALFQRIQQFLERLGNALRGRGFQTADDVFQAVRSGEVAARSPASLAQEATRAAGTGAAASAGAAAVQGSDYRLKGALGLEKGLKRLSPALWLQNSPSRVSRQIIDELGETGTYRTDHADWYESARLGAEMGQYGSVESRVKTFQGQSLAEAFTAIDDGFTAYRSGSEKRRIADITRMSLSDYFFGAGEKMEFKQFREAVGRAMAEGDAHEIPEVAATAKKLRPIFDRYLKDAIKLGMLPEGVSPETAPSYVTRIYDRNRIIAERPEFKQVIVDWLAEVERANARVREALSRHVAEIDRVEARIEKNEAKLAKRESRLKEFEKASEEVSRFNKFAYERATKRSEPIDALRQQIATINDSIAAPMQRIAELTAEIRGQKETIPGLREVERQMQIVSRRSSEIKKGGGELINDVEDAAAISDGLEAFAEGIADVLSRLRAEGRQLRAESDVAEQLKALEKERAKLSKRISPLRKRLNTLRGEMGGLEKRARGRAAETGAYQSRFRARGNKLADQISGRKADIESLRFGLENDNARVVELTKLIEEQVELYQGKTAGEAQSAISARRAADAERTEPRTAPAKMLKPVRAAAEKIAAQEGKDAAELPGLADQIIDRILGTPEGRLPYDSPTIQAKSGFGGVDMDARGPLAARQFMIPDRMIEQWLERDIDTIIRAYVHTMAPDIELTKRFGSPDMIDKFKEVSEEYARLQAQAKTPAERHKFSKQKDEDFRNIAAIRDRLRGTYAIPENPDAIMVRTARTALTLSYMSKLGGQVVSAFTDPARFVMVHGLAATFSDGLIPLFTNFKQFKALARDLETLHGAAEMITDNRALRMADISDSWGANTKFERLVQSGGRNFGMVSLMAPWNTIMKQFASILTLNRIMRNAVKRSEGKTLSRREQEFMAWSGISDGAARRMGVEFKANGVKQNGLWMPNTNAWSDTSRNVVDALSVALRKNVDTIIITPTAGELPKFHSKLWGKLLLQFKSFSISATQKMLIAGLQQRDMAALNGALLSIALGGLVYFLKGEMAGKPAIVPKSIDDPNWGIFFGEAFDRSGLAGVLGDANNLTEKVTHGKVGLSALTGKPISRYASRNKMQSVAGPVFGLAEDAMDIAESAFDDRPWTQKDTHRIRQIIPYQNLFYLRSAIDKAEAGINSVLGVPERASAH
jgi:hypothetical protein